MAGYADHLSVDWMNNQWFGSGSRDPDPQFRWKPIRIRLQGFDDKKCETFLYFLVFSFGWVSYCNPKRHDYYRENLSLLLLFHAKGLLRGPGRDSDPRPTQGHARSLTSCLRLTPSKLLSCRGPTSWQHRVYFEDWGFKDHDPKQLRIQIRDPVPFWPLNPDPGYEME